MGRPSECIRVIERQTEGLIEIYIDILISKFGMTSNVSP